MSLNGHTQHQAEQAWPPYTTDSPARPEPPAPAPQDDHSEHGPSHRGHGAHKWMMLLMCAPLVLIGVWALASGAGGGALIGGLLCMGMMAFMHLGMGGKGHRH
ncbi:MAG: hypothetical protein VB093_17205 [Propionicimonas sp.]|nr:hypothetical protein [Propionicimonas sp.]